MGDRLGHQGPVTEVSGPPSQHQHRGVVMILTQLLGRVSEAVFTKHWAQSLAYSQLTISVGKKEGGEDGHRREGDGGGRSG